MTRQRTGVNQQKDEEAKRRYLDSITGHWYDTHEQEIKAEDDLDGEKRYGLWLQAVYAMLFRPSAKGKYQMVEKNNQGSSKGGGYGGSAGSNDDVRAVGDGAHEPPSMGHIHRTEGCQPDVCR